MRIEKKMMYVYKNKAYISIEDIVKDKFDTFLSATIVTKLPILSKTSQAEVVEFISGNIEYLYESLKDIKTEVDEEVKEL